MSRIPPALERYQRGPSEADRAEMLEAIGKDEHFRVLTEEQKASVFRAMFDTHFHMDDCKRLVDGLKARMRERGPRTLKLALQHLLELRGSGPMLDVLLRAAVPWDESNRFFEFAQTLHEACDIDVAKTELDWDAPTTNKTLAEAQLEEAERLRGALAAVGIRSNELIGKMCRYTSGKAVGEEAIKKRFAARERQRLVSLCHHSKGE
jgi:hypothetical protein